MTVYENKNDSSKTADSYRLSEKASVSNGIDAGSIDKNGLVVLKNDGSDVIIRKPDYLDRTLTAARAQKAKMVIFLNFILLLVYNVLLISPAKLAKCLQARTVTNKLPANTSKQKHFPPRKQTKSPSIPPPQLALVFA